MSYNVQREVERPDAKQEAQGVDFFFLSSEMR